MTEDRRNASRSRRQSERYYVDGNTARQLNREPKRQRTRQQVQQPQPEIRHEKRVSAFDLKYTLFLVACVSITLLTCFGYMHANTQRRQTEQSIAALQSQLQEIQEQNLALEESMNRTIDLNEIYQTATKKLGMIYAGEDQIIYYNSSNSDYVRQYESIPGKK